MTLYLTLVLDLFSRQVVDWSMKSHMTTDNELARCLENPGRFNSYVSGASFSDKDEIIGEVFREKFEWLRQLQRIPEAWISVIFPLGGLFSPPSDSHECEYAIAKVMKFLSKSGS